MKQVNIKQRIRSLNLFRMQHEQETFDRVIQNPTPTFRYFGDLNDKPAPRYYGLRMVLAFCSITAFFCAGVLLYFREQSISPNTIIDPPFSVSTIIGSDRSMKSMDPVELYLNEQQVRELGVPFPNDIPENFTLLEAAYLVDVDFKLSISYVSNNRYINLVVTSASDVPQYEDLVSTPYHIMTMLKGSEFYTSASLVQGEYRVDVEAKNVDELTIYRILKSMK